MLLFKSKMCNYNNEIPTHINEMHTHLSFWVEHFKKNYDKSKITHIVKKILTINRKFTSI